MILFWMRENATFITAVGSLFMDLCTLLIIYFNLNQFKINRKSLYLDVNFRVFEPRQKIYKHITKLISTISSTHSFSSFISSLDQDYSSTFLTIKQEAEDCKHLFSDSITAQIEKLLLCCEQGVSLEKKKLELSKHDVNELNSLEKQQLEEYGARIEELVEYVNTFDTNQFLKYLDIMNFDKNLMLD